ncbi:hypothetical protein LR48_Vigan08g006900 [Vigna angularis]|uniref:Uncharacterized protein n=1 Tax=Phaseolus angularis TaxID=3914 RepID=A0A0L9V2W5_PHAAN|nr:hypothetical protein LR48_Vigan08g006900 [Vigna angularis]
MTTVFSRFCGLIPPVGHGVRRPQQAISTLGPYNRLPVEKSPFVPKVKECYPDMAEALPSSPDDCVFKFLWIDPPCWPWFKVSITRNFKFGQSYVDGRPSKGVSRSRGEVMYPSNRNDALVTKEEGTMHLSDEGATMPAEKRELWRNGAQKALQWRRERETTSSKDTGGPKRRTNNGGQRHHFNDGESFKGRNFNDGDRVLKDLSVKGERKFRKGGERVSKRGKESFEKEERDFRRTRMITELWQVLHSWWLYETWALPPWHYRLVKLGHYRPVELWALPPGHSHEVNPLSLTLDHMEAPKTRTSCYSSPHGSILST